MMIEEYLVSLVSKRAPPALLSQLRGESASHLVLHTHTASTLQCLLALMPRDRKVVFDVGTHKGYSCALLAEACPNATVHTFDRDGNTLQRAVDMCQGVFGPQRIVGHHGDAIELLRHDRALLELRGAVDVIFIDADKKRYPEYAKIALSTYLGPGGVLILDNMLWRGKVIQQAEAGNDDDLRTSRIRETNSLLASDPSVLFTLLPVGDGLAVAVKT